MTEEILMGIDYGESKIGTALGRNDLVMPLIEVNGKNDMTAVHELTRMILENKVSRIIMGLPVTIEGGDTYQARKVRRFSKLLKTISKKPVVFFNEYRTTKESLEEGYDKNLLHRGAHEDSLAAALILKRYYNEN
jgi:putative Holliday junction resolvase